VYLDHMLLGRMTYGTRQDHSIFVCSILTAASLGGLLLLPAPPRDQSYHLLADYRTVAGIPNFWNVASNIPFIAIGAVGLLRFRDNAATIVLFLGFFLTGHRLIILSVTPERRDAVVGPAKIFDFLAMRFIRPNMC
jgi:hypothetical protein